LGTKKINLIAVQARTELADYRDHRAFHTKMASLMELAAKEADFSLPTLVSFPELVGMFLSFVPFFWDDLRDERLLEHAAMKIVMRNLPRLNDEERRTPEAAARRLLFVDTALEAEAMYVGTFSSLAREYGAYVAAGSIALPPIEREPSKGGRHVEDATKVYNTSYLFSPQGVCLRRVSKVHMTAGFEERVFDGAPKSQLLPVDTRLGRVGTLVCWDGFHETLVEHCDAMGVQILLKPSYNQHPWDAPWPFDPSIKEGENWLNTGCPSIIQGRENIRYGVNAMMVGAVFEDVAAEGLSSVAVNTGRPGASWEDGILAIAQRPDGEEVVAVTVEAPGRP
jgi:predicted amidohydrolase